MHRIAARAGGWTPDTEGVIVIEQTPAPIIILTSADTDIQTLAASIDYLPDNFPEIRAVNLLQLQQQYSIDHYADTVLLPARAIVLRLLGGRSYWSYGLEVVKEIVAETGADLFVLPGDDKPDLELMGHSTVSRTAVNRLWRYFTEAGVENWVNALKFIGDTCFHTGYNPLPPREVPKVGSRANIDPIPNPRGRVAILFYRSHYLAGNTLVIDALVKACLARDLQPIPVYVSSLREPEAREMILQEFSGSIDLVLDTTSFSIDRPDTDSDSGFWRKLNVPVLQVIFSSGTLDAWRDGFQGLSPRDVAINVALPEVDGKIITRAVSFKSVQVWQEKLETEVVVYQPVPDRIDFVIELALHWVRLRKTPNQEKKIALILANYPNKDGRIANGVGLDTPASCINILHALHESGYRVEDIPRDGDELIRRLTAGITNDRETRELKPVERSLSLEDYRSYFQTLPEDIQTALTTRWGTAGEDLPIPGITLGNVFIGIQPSRGYDIDPTLNYHSPDLEPTHDYLAFYHWLREKFGAMAIVDIGKHGNLEWLPGKSIALSRRCYPEIALETLPHFYPFIVNDPGEGSSAKRRSHAVILDHLTPPITRAELYGDLDRLETLIDEYYEAQSLDPSRLPYISERITRLVRQTRLHEDLGFDTLPNDSLSQFLTLADGYLCELKEARIRDGLHIFGCCPEGVQLRDLIASIARSPGIDRLGLTRSIARDLDLDLDPLTTHDDETTRLELLALDLIERKIEPLGENSRKEFNWIENTLIPALQRTPEEITNLLEGLAGRFVPSGASGAPTRGRPEVLPTGRNFYSVDIRAIPTETAWEVGRKAAEALIERYTQENGEYPKTLAISIWGTSTMRNGGEDIAQVMALLGVIPIWDGFSRRVTGYEILTPSALGRPRVDVTVRVSGFFRDSFPNILQLLHFCISEVACQEEDEEINPLAAKVLTEKEFWENQGLDEEAAKLRATARIFGSKPGAYGAGLQGLIESQNWENDDDLARAYINWSCYAYDGRGVGHSLPEVFTNRLEQLQIVLHNQDNREHDLLDSDDYYQFQGGLTASVRSLTGKNPTTYFGDNSLPEQPKVRSLREEIRRVYRSRVINPKWIAGVMRHGYKGAFEMSATIDYLFAYDATARVVDDFMYRGVAEAYLFDERVRAFIQEKNPHALRDMGERLLEAKQRGLWQEVDAETLDRLRSIVHEAEGSIEGM
ncbi:cobaltochelatase subunit CobN [Pannus brasiliensis CCIBt3594]|uniref:Cobaltochelatase subunit CobN n=1 Tax=Pannus brasiliensis CCIBt3594 TaxID=1427578 RepID=A0AAW9QQC9_9CHRO